MSEPTYQQAKLFLSRVEKRERAALDRASIEWGCSRLPKPFLRQRIRDWFYPLKRMAWAEMAKHADEELPRR